MKKTIAVLLMVILSGCSQMQIDQISQSQPELKIEEYFDGKVYAWGIFEDRFGTIRRQFQVEIDGDWDGKTLTLDEQFLYDDGERDQRIWEITSSGSGNYEGQAADVLGTAAGTSQGNALNWKYDIDLKVGDGSWRVTFDDWMLLQQGGVLINRAYVKKWGFTIGTVTLSFMRGDAMKEVPFSL